MLDSRILEIYKDAVADEEGKEAFCSDWALSSSFGENSDETENYKIVEKIYDLAKMNAIELVRKSGMTQAKFANSFGMSIRTVESWSSGEKRPPDYVKLLLAESCGYFEAK